MSKIEFPQDYGDESPKFKELPNELIKSQPLRLSREMWQRIAALMTAADAVNSVPNNDEPESKKSEE